MKSAQKQADPTPVKYGFPSEDARDFPSMVILENTTVCNLRCIHCPQGQGYPEHPDYKPLYMEWDIYKKIIDEIAENKITLLRYSPAGEALVHPQFLDQLAYANAKGISPVNLTTTALTLDTAAIENGKRIPGKTIMDRLLDHGLDIIDISLDAATREGYETVRVGSNYHRVWSNVHRLLYLREKKKAHTKVMLSIIDQPESHEEVQQFVNYWTPLVDRVLVRNYVENLGLSPLRPGTEDNLLAEPVRWPCPQFWKRVTIGPDGHVRFCVVDWLEQTNIGDLRTRTIKEIWKSPEYERLRECHLGERYEEAHSLCGPCTDWKAMRWEWGFEVAVSAVMGGTGKNGGNASLKILS
ncbi:MAG: SPASM domain-containing protein [Nitrospinota bacterium]|nr:SPASM domain-containing protein [Nitrospinota bacterium]